MTRIALNTAAALGVLAGLYILWHVLGAVFLFAMSVVVAAAMQPLIEFFRRRKVPSALAVLGSYGLVLGILILLILGAGEGVIQDTSRAADDSLHLYERVQTTWPEGNRLEQAVVRWLPPLNDLLESWKTSSGSQLVQSVLGFTMNVLGATADLILIVVLSIYWSLDRSRFERLWLSLLSPRVRLVARQTWQNLEQEVGAYFRSEIVQSVLAGFLLAGTYWLIGHPYPIFLACVGAIAWLIPWVGILFALAAALLTTLPVALAEGSLHASFLAIATPLLTVAILLVIELWIEPRFFNRQRYNMVAWAVTSIALASVLGIVGLLLGPPLAIAVQMISGTLLRQRATAVVEGLAKDDLSERVADLRTSLARVDPQPPAIVNLLERLSQLVAAADNLPPALNGTAEKL